VATEPNNRRAGKLARTGPSQSEQIKTLQQDRLRAGPATTTCRRVAPLAPSRHLHRIAM
jgi:hypothetical protein